MKLKKQKSSNFRETISYLGNNTIMLIKYNQLEFITILRLEQHSNYEFEEKEQKDNYNEKLSDLIYRLRTFDNNSEVESGTIYKIYSHYKKQTLLQEYWLEQSKKSKINNIVFNKKQYKSENFHTLRKLQLKEKILNIPLYQKEDFLIIRTIKNKSQISFLPHKWSIKELFGCFNKKIYKSLKNNLDVLLNNHNNNFLGLPLIDKEQETTKKGFLKVLYKLGMKSEISGFKDINILENSQLINFNSNNTILKIKKTELDETPDIVELNPSFLIHKRFNKNDKIFLLKDKENINYSYDNSINKLIINKNKKNILSIDCLAVKETEAENYIQHCIMDNIPEVLEANVSEKIAETFKKINVEEFNIITEILKLDIKSTQKMLKSNKFKLTSLESLPDLKGKIFDKDLVKEKILGIDSMNYHINEGSQFNNVRFFVSFKNYYKNNLIFGELNETMKKYGVEFSMIPEIISDLANFNNKSSYIHISEKMINIENKELPYFINLKYGDKTFNKLSFLKHNDLEKMENSMIYVKRKETIEGINYFTGVDVFNSITAAPSGSGKSFITVNEVANFMSLEGGNNRITIIDRGGSYMKIVSVLGGTNIVINPASSENCINPFYFNHYMMRVRLSMILSDKYNIKKKLNNKKYIKNLSDEEIKKLKENEITDDELEILKILSKMPLKKGVDSEDKIVLDENDIIVSHSFKYSEPQTFFLLIIKFLENMLSFSNLDLKFQNMLNVRKIFNNELLKKYKENVLDLYKDINYYNLSKNEKEKMLEKEFSYSEFLLIEDLQKDLYTIIRNNNYKVKEELNSYIQNLDKFISTSEYGHLFNGKPNMKTEDNLINIDFQEIKDETILSLVAGALMMNFNSNMTNTKYKNVKKLLIIDEAHAIFESKDTSGLESISYLYRTVRKHGAAVKTLSQTISDFFKPPTHKNADLFSSLSGNSGWIQILKKPKIVAEVELLGCSENFKKYIRNNNSFRFVLISEETGVCDLIVSDLDYSLATTHKDETNIQKLLYHIFKNNKKAIILFSEMFKTNFINDFQSVIGFVNSVGAIGSLDILNQTKNDLLQNDILKNKDKNKILDIFNNIENVMNNSDKNKKNDLIKQFNSIFTFLKKNEMIDLYIDLLYNDNI